MKRVHNITTALDQLREFGVISEWTWGARGGNRVWTFTPESHSEQTFTTTQVEAFIIGASASLAARADSSQSSARPGP